MPDTKDFWQTVGERMATDPEYRAQLRDLVLEAAVRAVAGVELNCPHCGERSAVSGEEVRKRLLLIDDL